MLFHTWLFLLFFIIVYPLYLVLQKTRFKNLWLLVISYVFYGWWNPLYLLLIAYATTVDFGVAAGMARGRYRKAFLALSIVNNLTVLGFFKYARFITENINDLFISLSLSIRLPEPDILLPVGISFFIFQSMSYTIDFYRGQVRRETNFIRYAAFVSLFSQLVAGPIERARNLLPQLQQTPKITGEDISEGACLFLVGLFKKVALADYLALYVDPIYAAPGRYQSPALVLATFAFAWQIYFDFSGYTDMARGIGRLMGIRLSLNFNRPYLASGLGDFWRRWHISLSGWFKDYLYIPLGGNRKGTLATYRNIFLTMVISGLWHGAAWTFVCWGALHALGRFLTRALERTPFYQQKIPRIFKQLGVFLFVMFAWIFFRADSITEAWTIVKQIFSSGWADPKFPLWMAILILLVWGFQWVAESRWQKVLARREVRIGLVLLMALYLLFFASSSNKPFIYFQF